MTTYYTIANAGYTTGRKYSSVTKLLRDYGDETDAWRLRNPLMGYALLLFPRLWK